MGREKKMVKMSKIRRIELTKKVRVLCNFCERSRSRYELRPHQQAHQAVSSMETQLKRLRLLTRRLTGMDLYGLSFTELNLLESQLNDALPIVRNQKNKVKLQEDEMLCKQKKRAENDNVLGGELSVPGSSSEERPQKQDDEAPVSRVQRAFERQNAESMQSEFERLWRLNERMNGRELDGMTFYELLLLEGQILDGIYRVKDQRFRPRSEEIARQRKEELISLLAEQETCSLDNGNGNGNGNGKDDRHRDIPLRFGSQHTVLSVSRKLRRFQNRYHRKNMPEIKLVCQVASD